MKKLDDLTKMCGTIRKQTFGKHNRKELCSCIITLMQHSLTVAIPGLLMATKIKTEIPELTLLRRIRNWTTQGMKLIQKNLQSNQ